MTTQSKQIHTTLAALVICVLIAMWACGCMGTSSHYETAVTDPNGFKRTVYVRHDTHSFLYDLSKVKVDLKLKDIGSLEVLGSVAEAQKIEDIAPSVGKWAGTVGIL